jgi:hypothetical protein
LPFHAERGIDKEKGYEIMMVDKLLYAMRMRGLNANENDVKAIINVLRYPSGAMIQNAMPHMDSWSSNFAWWDSMLDGIFKK